MRLINTKAHGIYDYLLSLVLFCSPMLFEYGHGSGADKVHWFVSVYLLVMAMSTQFEFSLFKLIPIKAHLFLDILLGVFLAASPWLFQFDEHVYKPQLVFGLSLIFVSLLTDRVPSAEVKKMMVKNRSGKKVQGSPSTPKPDSGFPGLVLIRENDDYSILRSVKKHLKLSEK